jgi:hypothetical protein
MKIQTRLTLPAALLALHLCAGAADCAGTAVNGVQGWSPGWKLADGSLAGFAKMNVNIDGYGRAYHRRNAAGGALIHLCNAGRVHLPGGQVYEGSESNPTCTGKFMEDLARIEAAGWADPAVGVVEWYGILGEGSTKINGRTVGAVKPVPQADGSGFFVSPTSLVDKSVTDPKVQARYVNPLHVPSAVMPRSLAAQGIAFGSFGVAYRLDKKIAVPFVVGDGGPRVGEGSVALARLAAGLPVSDDITAKNRFQGQVDGKTVLWVFFGGAAAGFDGKDEAATVKAADAAFQAWGGNDRLARCVDAVPKP